MLFRSSQFIAYAVELYDGCKREMDGRNANKRPNSNEIWKRDDKQMRTRAKVEKRLRSH